ncbi:molybdopterin molybdotransferase MoeA [Gordonia sp. C13]|uniref:molybdopterin molybdotransferase MoeA n=1 Tax=Gordonia sp. C13 TaxID=2935078 RepID=UPI00200B5ED9|nr:gephyrin-like molybdotransferase Glp [Gordonia sp. C13]MCK8615313.1 molybdopterin molybdotransferase MoeA [Gordonia sp. C13]
MTSAALRDDHSVVRYHEYLSAVEAALATACERASARVAVETALGLVLTADARARVDIPVFRNSQMDGYAVDSETVSTTPIELPIAGVLPAGWSGAPCHTAGAAERIMTGAMLPDGADTVIPVEETEPAAEPGRVIIRVARPAGAFVREAGCDVMAGDVMVSNGTRLEPRHLAALACAGVHTVQVRPRLTVAIITTGAELAAPEGELSPGQIFDGNSVGLRACVERDGAVLALVERCSDNPRELRGTLERAAAAADLVLTSGGISAGDFEVVREVLGSSGRFGLVAMQPGGPQGLASIDGTPVLCFPGNPVSTLVSYEVFASAAIRQDAGLPPRVRETRRLTHALTSIAGKRQFFRGDCTPDGVRVTSGPGSHLISAMAQSDSLVVVNEDTSALSEGDEVQTWIL